jgi:hypothetical protein
MTNFPLLPFFRWGIKTQGSRKDPPLVWLLKHGKDLDPESLQQNQLMFYCTQAWPKSPLGDDERWPEGGNINYNTILQLDIFCKKERKWTKVPYVQLFFFLRDHPDWLNKCRLHTQTMVTLCKKPPNSLEPKTPSAPPHPHFPATSHTRHHLIGLYLLQLIPGGDKDHVPFRVSELKEMKKDLVNYTENQDQYIQAFREVSQNFELRWKEAILLLSQTHTSLEKQWVLNQAVTAGDDYHLDKSGPTGLFRTGPSQEEEGEGEERQRHWLPKTELQFTIQTGD